MAAMIIRNLDDSTKRRLRERAAKNGRSMEAEARLILGTAVGESGYETNLADLATQLFGKKHGVDLEPHPAVRARRIQLS